MTLTKDDVQLIKGALQPEFEGLQKKVSDVETRLQKGITDFRLEVRNLFKGQAEHLSRAITDAVKMMADKELTEAKLQELEDQLDDLQKEVQKLKNKIATA